MSFVYKIGEKQINDNIKQEIKFDFCKGGIYVRVENIIKNGDYTNHVPYEFRKFLFCKTSPTYKGIFKRIEKYYKIQITNVVKVLSKEHFLFDLEKGLIDY